MKHNEIEQAVIELCDAVPEFGSSSHGYKVLFWHHGSEVLFCNGLTTLTVHEDELPIIAQHAKHWAAQQEWVPYTDFHSGVYSLYLVDDSLEYPAMGAQTEWRKFDPLVLGSEELQWIRAVTEAAELMEENPCE